MNRHIAVVRALTRVWEPIATSAFDDWPDAAVMQEQWRRCCTSVAARYGLTFEQLEYAVTVAGYEEATRWMAAAGVQS